MDHPAQLFFSAAHPFFSKLDVDFVESSAEKLVLKFVAQNEFVECRQTGRLHSGFCALLLDTVMGGSVMGMLGKMQPIATINLTTQHSARPHVGDAILCTAITGRIENQVAVVTGHARLQESGELLASAVGSFMIGTRATPLQTKSGAKS